MHLRERYNDGLSHRAYVKFLALKCVRLPSASYEREQILGKLTEAWCAFCYTTSSADHDNAVMALFGCSYAAHRIWTLSNSPRQLSDYIRIVRFIGAKSARIDVATLRSSYKEHRILYLLWSTALRQLLHQVGGSALQPLSQWRLDVAMSIDDDYYGRHFVRQHYYVTGIISTFYFFDLIITGYLNENCIPCSTPPSPSSFPFLKLQILLLKTLA